MPKAKHDQITRHVKKQLTLDPGEIVDRERVNDSMVDVFALENVLKYAPNDNIDSLEVSRE